MDGARLRNRIEWVESDRVLIPLKGVLVGLAQVCNLQYAFHSGLDRVGGAVVSKD